MVAGSLSEVSNPNPTLQPLGILIGEWTTTGKHPLMPDKVLHGHTSFKWLESGAFIIMHSTIHQEEFPDGIAIFGSDNSSNEYSMIYYDVRKISRKYISTINNNIWKWWRNDPEFSQRFICTISEDGNTIISKGEMSVNGKSWEKDLELTYTRIL